MRLRLQRRDSMLKWYVIEIFAVQVLPGLRFPELSTDDPALIGNSFLLLFNAQPGPIDWTLPKQWGKRWEAVLDTFGPQREGETFDSGTVLPATGRSVVVLQRLDEPSP